MILKKEGVIIVYFSYYIEEVEYIVDRILVFYKGKLLCDIIFFVMK